MVDFPFVISPTPHCVIQCAFMSITTVDDGSTEGQKGLVPRISEQGLVYDRSCLLINARWRFDQLPDADHLVFGKIHGVIFTNPVVILELRKVFELHVRSQNRWSVDIDPQKQLTVLE